MRRRYVHRRAARPPAAGERRQCRRRRAGNMPWPRACVAGRRINSNHREFLRRALIAPPRGMAPNRALLCRAKKVPIRHAHRSYHLHAAALASRHRIYGGHRQHIGLPLNGEGWRPRPRSMMHVLAITLNAANVGIRQSVLKSSPPRNICRVCYASALI